jgi:tetratricopeptide (TPR) repeat protein
VTLAEILKEQGYTTGAVIAAFILDSRFGLNQGFDTYNEKFDEELNTIGIAERRGGEVTKYGIEWIDEHKDQPFFLFLHYYDPHATYDPPEAFRMSEFSDRRLLYSDEIAYTDHCIGQVIEKLKNLGLYDSTLIIVTGDHGEALGEHFETTHGYFIYEETTKVPLIFKLPGRSQPKKVKDVVGLIDIVPTVCSLVGVEPPSGIQGVDLSMYFTKHGKIAEERYLFSESMQPTKIDCSSLLSVVTNRFKYIQTTRPELYDLINDPQERKNIVDEHPQKARIMQDQLRQILEESVRKIGTDSQLTLDEESKNRLGALGYIAGESVTEDFSFDQSKDDPKDFIDFQIISSQTGPLIHDKQYAKARELIETLLKRRPNFALGHERLSRIDLAEGKTEEAIERLKKALEMKPELPDSHNNLAMIYIEQKEYDQAYKHLSKALDINPDHLYACNNMADLLFKQDKSDEALAQWKRSLTIKRNQPDVCNNVGRLYVQQGEYNEAMKYYLKSLEYEPAQSRVQNSLGLIFIQLNKPDDAILCYSESLKMDPNQPKVYNTWGLILSQQGQFDQAISKFSESLMLEPDQEAIQNNIADIYFQQGKNDLAIMYWRKALEIKPDMVIALNNMAWLKAVHDQEPYYDPNEAVRLAERAVKLTEDQEPGLLDTLSVAYASAGRFDEAIKAAEKAIELALSSQQDELADVIKNHLELYKAGQPYLVE